MAHSILTSTARLWLGEDGFIHLRPHARREHTLADAIENVAAVKTIQRGLERSLLIHFEDAAPQTAECRSYYVSAEAGRGLIAVAVVTASLLGRIVGNLMIGMSGGTVPVRLFDDEKAASVWLTAQNASRAAGAKSDPPPGSKAHASRAASARTPR